MRLGMLVAHLRLLRQPKLDFSGADTSQYDPWGLGCQDCGDQDEGKEFSDQGLLLKITLFRRVPVPIDCMTRISA